MITGAAGMLGRDLGAAVAQAGHEPVGVVRSELDIADPGAVRAALRRVAPEVVVNCAAWTDVDGAEADEAAALAVNGTGAGHLAAAAHEVGAWTIHISTDYVFDGLAREPYLESDPVGPQSAYGRTKLAGERAVAAAAPACHTIVRSSWLFGVGGRCFPDTMLRLAAERDALTVVDDQVGCPTFTGHLAAALVDLALSPPTGLVHAAGGGECSWFEFAREIVGSVGSDCRVEPVGTADFPRPAARPAYSVLRTERPDEAPELPHWRQGLREYLALRVGSALAR